MLVTELGEELFCPSCCEFWPADAEFFPVSANSMGYACKACSRERARKQTGLDLTAPGARQCADNK